jgi:hypothetical protein
MKFPYSLCEYLKVNIILNFQSERDIKMRERDKEIEGMKKKKTKKS